MSIFDIIVLAIALSIDACVVSFSQGLVFTYNRVKNSLLLAFAVGFFQFLMPLIGASMAFTVHKYVEPIAPWIVFVIFVVLGIKFIKDAFKEEEQEKLVCNLCFKYILAVAVATSIDALAAGVTIYFSGVKVFVPAVIIGIITFVNSLLGFWSGQVFKKFPSRNLEIASGMILIFLGVKVLVESFV